MAPLGGERSPRPLSQHHQRGPNQAAGGAGSGWTQCRAHVEIQGWPSARGPEVASLWRDRLAGASELQAWAGGCVRIVSDAH